MTKKTSPSLSNPADLTYEEARDELMETVRRLEQGSLTLEESLALWERGEQLGSHCERLLAGAHARVEKTLRTNEVAAGDSADEG